MNCVIIIIYTSEEILYMKKTAVRILSLLISLLLVICPIGCAGDGNSVTQKDVGQFKLSAKYNIITHSLYKSTSDLTDALVLVRKALDACGIESSYSTDTSKRGDKTEAGEYEILLGYTGRADSQSVVSELGINDYTYRVISENVIVICGGSTSATLEAAKKFCLDVLGYDGEHSFGKSEVSVSIDTQYTYTDNYGYSSLSIDSVELKDFRIAIDSAEDMPLAQNFVKRLGRYTGFSIPIVKYTELVGNERGVICIGSYNREQTKKYESLTLGGKMYFSIDDGKITIGADASGDKYFNDITDKFFESVEISTLSKKMQISLPGSEIEIMDLENTYGDIPTWSLVKETKKEICDGVSYLERHYKDENSLPYKAYILFVDPTKASFYMGTGKDEYVTTPIAEDRQSVVGHMQSAVANGVDVIAGTNGDFFAISSNYIPTGLAVKEGTKLCCVDSARPYIAFTYDGKAAIYSNAHNADISNVRTAIGGRQVIVYDSMPHDIGRSTDFGETSHPRTLAGIMADGTVIMAVIDGRQKSHSNGAPLGQCAKFMISLGAVTAINLDGGGSSTMVIRNGSTYNVKNSPSDGAPRRIYNSLLVVKDKENN